MSDSKSVQCYGRKASLSSLLREPTHTAVMNRNQQTARRSGKTDNPSPTIARTATKTSNSSNNKEEPAVIAEGRAYCHGETMIKQWPTSRSFSLWMATLYAGTPLCRNRTFGKLQHTISAISFFYFHATATCSTMNQCRTSATTATSHQRFPSAISPAFTPVTGRLNWQLFLITRKNRTTHLWQQLNDSEYDKRLFGSYDCNIQATPNCFSNTAQFVLDNRQRKQTQAPRSTIIKETKKAIGHANRKPLFPIKQLIENRHRRCSLQGR